MKSPFDGVYGNRPKPIGGQKLGPIVCTAKAPDFPLTIYSAVRGGAVLLITKTCDRDHSANRLRWSSRQYSLRQHRTTVFTVLLVSNCST